MSLASTLLRVVLMLSLLLNGLNAAMASGHEDMGRMAHAMASAMTDEGDADCHHHAGMTADEVRTALPIALKALRTNGDIAEANHRVQSGSLKRWAGL